MENNIERLTIKEIAEFGGFLLASIIAIFLIHFITQYQYNRQKRKERKRIQETVNKHNEQWKN